MATGSIQGRSVIDEQVLREEKRARIRKVRRKIPQTLQSVSQPIRVPGENPGVEHRIADIARQVIADPFRVEDRRRIETAMVGYINAASRLTFGRIQPGAAPPTVHTWHFDVNLKGYKDLYARIWWEQHIVKWALQIGLRKL